MNKYPMLQISLCLRPLKQHLQLYISCFEQHHHFPAPNFCNNDKHTLNDWPNTYMRKTKLVEVRVWYHGGYVKITVTHRAFCSFCKITASHRDSDIPTVIPNTVEISINSPIHRGSTSLI
jgi:hypothetical protein